MERSNTRAATLSGSNVKISFNGKAIVSPPGAAGRAAAGVVAAGAAGDGLGADEGVGAGAGGVTDSSTAGAADDVLVVLEKNFLKTPNINRAAFYSARAISARR